MSMHYSKAWRRGKNEQHLQRQSWEEAGAPQLTRRISNEFETKRSGPSLVWPPLASRLSRELHDSVIEMRCNAAMPQQQHSARRKSSELRILRSNYRQTKVLVRLPGQQAEVEKWALSSTKCNKGEADHTEGKERCLQPVKRRCVAYREADRG